MAAKVYNILLIEDIFDKKSFMYHYKEKHLVKNNKLKELSLLEKLSYFSDLNELPNGTYKENGKYRDRIKKINSFEFNIEKNIEKLTEHKIRLHIVSNADDGYKSIQKNKYDLVITDLGLPVNSFNDSEILNKHKERFKSGIVKFINNKKLYNGNKYVDKDPSLKNPEYAGIVQETIKKYIKNDGNKHNNVQFNESGQFLEDITSNIGASLAIESEKRTPTVIFTNGSHHERGLALSELMGYVSRDNVRALYHELQRVSPGEFHTPNLEKPINAENVYVGDKMLLEHFAYVIDNAISKKLEKK